MVRGWTMVCAGMILAGQQLSPAWLLAGDQRADGEGGRVRAGRAGQQCARGLAPAACCAAKRARSGHSALWRRSIDPQRKLRWGPRPGRGGRGGGRGMEGPADGRAGRGAEPAAASAPPSLSPNRIARLKRYDMSWQAALGKLDAGKLSVAGRAELETLKATIQANLAVLETDTAKVAELMPLVPFAPSIVKLNETRIRMEDVNSQEAAGVLTELTKEVARVRARVEAGLNGAGAPMR